MYISPPPQQLKNIAFWIYLKGESHVWTILHGNEREEWAQFNKISEKTTGAADLGTVVTNVWDWSKWYLSKLLPLTDC